MLGLPPQRGAPGKRMGGPPPGARPAEAAADPGQPRDAGQVSDAGSTTVPGAPRAPLDDGTQKRAWAAFAASPVLESWSCSEAGRPRSSGAQPHPGARMAYRAPRLALSIRFKIGNGAPFVGALS
jgi:hypothetical protein